MKLTAQIRLLPTPQQATALRLTLERGNEACNLVSAYAFEQKVFRSQEIQKVLYYRLKEEFGLSAQFVIRCLAKVADSYKTLKAQIRNHNATCEPDKKRSLTQISYRPTGAIAFDSRILSYRTDRKTVSIWTVEGRKTITYTVGQHHEKLLHYQQGESDLAFIKGKWYLLATCDVPDEEGGEIVDALGVDLGIVTLATDSDGQTFSGANVEATRQWYAKRRATLQSVGTKSAKCRLKKLSRKQRRFQSDTNHCISKSLVSKAKASNRAIVLEDLTGISKNVRKDEKRLRQWQRAKHANWAFYQLRRFIGYKATLSGVAVLLIDPRNTSRMCSQCGHCEKANRKSQSEFVCRSCGHSANADYNASQNIKNSGLGQIAYGVESGTRSLTTQAQAPGFSRG
ncbi:RNA-guided endonuclease InsQ/TnpB family protein [Spirosoma montaniterrae]|uniref:RNA-guided endonuclease InsQ/TnpB family protein n=1 Tax=Spirosoma montaniterrae TaxID=1178516 RepID=UPI00097D6AD6|nr:RNA-guided endonuclease TnpB family protein [Spirosoma montaniterrae]